MPVTQAILYALFCMLVVFLVLIALWAIIKLFSYCLGIMEGRAGNKE